MNKPLKVRTKVERKFYAGVLVCLLLTVSFSSLNALTVKLGTDSTGQDWGIGGKNVVSNSNGNVWTVTGTNIQTAIYDLNGTGGTVWVGDNVELSNAIDGRINVTLDFTGHTVNPASSFDMINMKPGFHLKNVVFDCSNIVFTNNVTVFDGKYMFAPDKPSTLENIKYFSASQKGTAIYLKVDTDVEHVVGVIVRNIMTNLFEHCIHIHASNVAGTAFVNANMFVNVMDNRSKQPIYLDRNTGLAMSASATNYNQFVNINLQNGTGTYTVNPGVYIEGQCNMFLGLHCYDFGNKAVDLTADSNRNVLYAHGLSTSNTVNSGTYNTINYDTAFAPAEIDCDNYNVGTATNEHHFASTAINPIMYLYGYDAGSASTKYMSFNIGTAGEGFIRSQTGESIIIDAGGTTVGGNLFLHQYAGGDIYCFNDIGASRDYNRYVYVKGRNAANDANHHLYLRWGDGANDRGIIGTDAGDLYLNPNSNVVPKNLILPTTNTTGDVTGACWFDAGASKLMIYDGSGWKSTTLT